MGELINIENVKGELVVSSREVAKNFGKEHKHVLRDIDNIKLDGVAQNWAGLFIENEYQHEQNKQSYREYLITKDGFALLAMGFTGKKALEWKLKYIEVFNKMDHAIKENNNLQIDSKFIYQIAQQLEEKENQIKEQRPKVLFAEAVENSEDVILVKEMALILTQQGFKIGQNQLFEYLRKNEFLCKKVGDMYNLPTKKYEHFFKVTKRTIQHTNGTSVKNTPKITGKGQMYFVRKFAEYNMQGLTVKELLNKGDVA